MKTVLVTGANGYIGRHVVDKLIELGNEVYACDFRFDGVNPKAKQIKAEIFSGDKDIFDKVGRPDACIHMAWRNGFVHNSESHIEDLPMHYTFIKNMIEGGCKQIAVMGTMHEVGYWEGAICDDTPCKPLSVYGVSKNALRQLMFSIPHDDDVCLQWIRAYYILGDDLHNNSIFTKICQKVEEGAKTFPFTSGKNLYDFEKVDDLAYQIASVMSQREVDGIINCCSGKPMSLADKVEEFIKEHEFDIKLEYGAFPDRPYDSPGVWGDATKINKIIDNQK